MRGRLAQSSEVPLDDVFEERLLVLRAQESPHAFEPLYLRYRDAVINYCFYRLGNHGEAEDAASVIFIKAIRGLADFRDRDGSFRTWLFRIAHNEVVDRLRHRARHPESPIDLFRERPGPNGRRRIWRPMRTPTFASAHCSRRCRRASGRCSSSARPISTHIRLPLCWG